MDMYRSIPIPQLVEMGSNYTEKMSEAKITEPTACSLDAFQIPIEFTLSGPTKDEAEAAKEDIKKDVGATFGQSTDLVEVEIKEVRRLIGRVGRVLAEKTVQVKAMVKTSSEADAKSAYQKLAAKPVHLVISDYNMPNMDGLQLLEALRRTKSTSRIGFILVSGRVDDEILSKGKKLALNNFISKPFDTQGLRDCIEKVVGKL